MMLLVRGYNTVVWSQSLLQKKKKTIIKDRTSEKRYPHSRNVAAFEHVQVPTFVQFVFFSKCQLGSRKFSKQMGTGCVHSEVQFYL